MCLYRRGLRMVEAGVSSLRRSPEYTLTGEGFNSVFLQDFRIGRIYVIKILQIT